MNRKALIFTFFRRRDFITKPIASRSVSSYHLLSGGAERIFSARNAGTWLCRRRHQRITSQRHAALLPFPAARRLTEDRKWKRGDDQLERRREVRKGSGGNDRVRGLEGVAGKHRSDTSIISIKAGTHICTSHKKARNYIMGMIHLLCLCARLSLSLIPAAVLPQLLSIRSGKSGSLGHETCC